MPNEFILFLYYLMWYLLIGMALLFVFSDLDDLFFDFYYWIRAGYRAYKTRKFPPLSYQTLVEKEEQLIAVLLPCWHEANVIGVMLKHNAYAIDYKNYYIFVGMYPNDPEGVAEVEAVSKLMPNIVPVVGAQDGPTNKASNLNGVYLYIKEFEKKLGREFDIFVFHDSEDIIHPLSFKLYNLLVPRKDMVQIPVLPLKVSYWNFTHWLYADEFSENHTKDIIVRESIKGHVPSAGVGTAFARKTLQVLEDPTTHWPFATDSLTEDYRTSLFVKMHGLTPIFAVQYVTRLQWVPKGLFRRRYVQKQVREIIATRALFPMEYIKSVRQKARWIIGIVFQEWSHTQWPRSPTLIFTLAHDRKASFSHFINGFGYLVFSFWLLYSFLTYAYPAYPSLQEQMNLHPWVWYLLIIVTLMMFERFLQRMIATWRVYGWIPALLSLPRTFYGNILNLHAVLRAYRIYYQAPKTQSKAKQPTWDKTDHHFPGSHLLSAFHRRLGDLLLDEKCITEEQLREAILKQRETGQRLGELLVQLNYVQPRQILEALSNQYDLPIIPKSQAQDCQAFLPKKLAHWVEKRNLHCLGYDEKKQQIRFVLEDPTNEPLVESIINHVAPLKAEFALLDQDR